MKVGSESVTRIEITGFSMDPSPVSFKKFVQFGITYCSWKDYQINIIDTDYYELRDDVQKALRVVDGAVLVLCSVPVMVMFSEIVDEHMKAYEIPRLVFIDNLDEEGANPWEVLNQARSKLGHHSTTIQVPIGLEDNFKGLVDLVQLKAYFFHAENVVVEEVPEALVLDKRRKLVKYVSEVDGKLAEAFHSNKPISSAELEEAVRRATIAWKFIPVFMGSALRNGRQPLLDAVLSYLPCPVEVSKYALDQAKSGEKVELFGSPDGPLVTLAFDWRVCWDSGLTFTFLRIYEGVLREGDIILNSTGKKIKVSSLFLPDGKDYPKFSLYTSNKYEIQEAHAGQLVAILYDNCESDSDFCISGETLTDGSVRYIMPPAPVTKYSLLTKSITSA